MCSSPIDQSMMGFIFMLVIVASSLQNKCRADTQNLASQLLPLQESLQQKDSYLFGLDEVISDLQRKLQGLKEKNDVEEKELLVHLKSKIEEEEAKVVELETILVRKSKELLNLIGQAQTLQSNVESQELEIKQVVELETILVRKSKELLNLRAQVESLQSNVESQELEINQLEIFSASQSKDLDEVQETLHLIEESVLEAQAHGDQNEQEIYKVIKNKWILTLKERWKKAVHVVGANAKGLKHLEVLQLHVLKCLQEAQKICTKKIEAAWELSRGYGLEPYFTQVESVLHPYASKLWQFYIKTLRYGIKHHLKLQGKVRSMLQKNRHLVSVMSKEVVWLLASAMLVVPLYGILLLFSSFFGKKRGSQLPSSETSYRRKEVRHTRHIHRRPK